MATAFNITLFVTKVPVFQMVDFVRFPGSYTEWDHLWVTFKSYQGFPGQVARLVGVSSCTPERLLLHMGRQSMNVPLSLLSLSPSMNTFFCEDEKRKLSRLKSHNGT